MAAHSSALAWEIPGTGAWRAAVYGVAQSRARLKLLSSSSSSSLKWGRERGPEDLQSTPVVGGIVLRNVLSGVNWQVMARYPRGSRGSTPAPSGQLSHHPASAQPASPGCCLKAPHLVPTVSSQALSPRLAAPWLKPEQSPNPHGSPEPRLSSSR